VQKDRNEESNLMDLLFSQSLTGMFFMMLDEPVVWNNSVDKKAVMDYVFAHQRVTHVNQAFLDQYGMAREDMLGSTPNTLYAHHLVQGKTVWCEFFDKGRLHIDTDERRADGSQMWVLGDYICMYDAQGRITGHFGMQIDVTGSKAAEEALRKSEEKYRLITEQTADVIWVLDLQKRIFSYISPSIKLLTGYTFDEISALSLKKIVVGDSYKKIKAMEDDVVRGFLENPNLQTTHILEIQHYCKTGILVWVEASFRLRFNENNQIEVVGVSRNIEERKKNEQEVLFLSYHDQLTGLYNRRFYERELSLLDTKHNLPITLIVADVNGLKLTNDVFGHQVGDTILKIFSSVLQKTCRPQDIAIRISGDEFVLFLPQTDSMDAQVLVEKIKQAIAKERIARASVSVSFGWKTKTEPNELLSTVFKHAEDAMYSHKFLESNQHKLDTIGLITSSMYEKGVSEHRHGERVRDLCIQIGEALQLDRPTIHDLGVAGLLHDIGKIGIDAHLIDKQGPLDEFEWQEIRRHCEIGYSILSSVHEYVNIAGYVLSHHERIDGKGYPRGLKGEEIPLQARIIAIANAYDSMTQEHRYKEQLEMVSASHELQKHADTQFDMDVTRIFVEKVLKLSWNPLPI